MANGSCRFLSQPREKWDRTDVSFVSSLARLRAVFCSPWTFTRQQRKSNLFTEFLPPSILKKETAESEEDSPLYVVPCDVTASVTCATGEKQPHRDQVPCSELYGEGLQRRLLPNIAASTLNRNSGTCPQ